MKRSGFTMVELIFVIVIIGILAATALPKFTNVKDNAKANSEVSAMNSLDGTIVAAVEFRLQDYKDANISWHSATIPSSMALIGRSAYSIINTDLIVLKTIMDKGGKFKITGFMPSDGTAIHPGADVTDAAYDVLFITGEASDASNGLATMTNDILGKPDKNDVWVFNPNTFDVNITSNPAGNNPVVGGHVIVSAQSIKLVDTQGTNNLIVTNLKDNATDFQVILVP